jgi:aspartate-semialdehyde dehydrogenase
MSRRVKVGILGCTGLVGQRIIESLNNHPVFEISALYARSEREGQVYGKSTKWVCESLMDENISKMKISSMDNINAYKGVELIFSALPADVATRIEGNLRDLGYGVVSNARSYRMDNEVPLLVPEINANMVELISAQKEKYNGGFIATNPNCSTIGVVLAMGPIEKKFGISNLHIATLQGVSGAGLTGLSAYEAISNVIPNIAGEEEKIRIEIPKIFGRNDLPIRARVNRVAVSDAHTFNIWFETNSHTSVQEIYKTWENYELECGDLPAINGNIYNLYKDNDMMPQPRLNAWYMNGMGTSIGRLEALSSREFCVTAVSNNTIRGAAGGTKIVAELIYERGLI